MNSPSPNPDSVAIFLRDNPGFFSAHPELLAQLNLQHQTGGKTVSLIERQIDLLREKKSGA